MVFLGKDIKYEITPITQFQFEIERNWSVELSHPKMIEE